MIHVVVGVIFNSQGQLLVTQRPPQKSWSGYWEFPGGKLEPGETPFQTLVRELKEELAIEVLSAKAWSTLKYTYPEKTVFLDLWLVSRFQGTLNGLEGQAFQWVDLNNLPELEFLPANKLILESIKNHSLNLPDSLIDFKNSAS